MELWKGLDIAVIGFALGPLNNPALEQKYSIECIFDGFKIPASYPLQSAIESNFAFTICDTSLNLTLGTASNYHHNLIVNYTQSAPLAFEYLLVLIFDDQNITGDILMGPEYGVIDESIEKSDYGWSFNDQGCRETVSPGSEVAIPFTGAY